MSRSVAVLAACVAACASPSGQASFRGELRSAPAPKSPPQLSDDSLGPRPPWPVISEAALSSPLESWSAVEATGWSVRFPASFQMTGSSGILWSCGSPAHRCRFEVDERGPTAASYVAGAREDERTVSVDVFDLGGDPLVRHVDRRNDGTEWTWLLRRHAGVTFSFGYASREPPRDFLAIPQTMRFVDAI